LVLLDSAMQYVERSMLTIERMASGPSLGIIVILSQERVSSSEGVLTHL
jgi:hypothetical protein